jgi:hypothetical protein
VNNGIIMPGYAPPPMPRPLLGRPVAVEMINAYGYDADSLQYIRAVEAADGARLELGVRVAIAEFVAGCKADGIWVAIKASCILAGARTLAGALVPLAGAGPTNVNFVSANYNRKTGLAGDGSTKYLSTNRQNNADPQNNRHVSVWVSTAAGITTFGGDIGYYAGASAGNTYIGKSNFLAQVGMSSTLNTLGVSSLVTGFRGLTRREPFGYVYRAGGLNAAINTASATPASGNIEVFSAGSSLFANSRLSFYSIGESLDLTLLDARVSTLMSSIGAAL